MTGKPDGFMGIGCGRNTFCLLMLLVSNGSLANADEGAVKEPAAVAVGEEMLDLAIEQCLRGEAARAQAIFDAIREQLDPSHVQLEVIRRYEATGCQLPKVSPSVRWNVQFGAGYDNNVNQGIAAQYMILGSGSNAIELELGDVYKPKASAFGAAGFDASFKLGNFAVGQISLQHRENYSLPALNLTGLVAGIIRPFVLLDHPGRIQLDVGETWLGGSRYQAAEAIGLQWLLVEGKQPWLANMTTLRSRYPSQPNQDSQLTEAGIWREQLVGSDFGVFGGVSALYDHAIRQRPGGDRAGLRLQFGVTSVWNEWLVQPRLNILRWQGSEAYSPGLVDVVRRHQLSQLGLQLTRPIGQGQQLVVEWRLNDARDSIPLFSYRSQSLGIYWRAQR